MTLNTDDNWLNGVDDLAHSMGFDTTDYSHSHAHYNSFDSHTTWENDHQGANLMPEKEFDLSPLESHTFNHSMSSLHADDSSTTDTGSNQSDLSLGSHHQYDSSSNYDHVIGHPEHSISHFEPQHYDNTCVPAVQHSIIAEQTGQNLSESRLGVESLEQGIMTPDGIPGLFLASELNQHDVSSQTHLHGNIHELESLVERGESVMALVDKDVLQHPDSHSVLHELDKFAPPEVPHLADHAVQYTGTVEKNGQSYAVVNDPGVPNGAGELIPMEQFEKAWDQSGDMYVATNMHEHPEQSNYNHSGTDLLMAFGKTVHHYHHLARSNPDWPSQMSGDSDSGPLEYDSDGDGDCDGGD